MGFRFSKRMRALPGISLNFGKSGESTTLGPRGARVALAQGKVRQPVGISGPGFSYARATPHPDETSAKRDLTYAAGASIEFGPSTQPHLVTMDCLASQVHRGKWHGAQATIRAFFAAFCCIVCSYAAAAVPSGYLDSTATGDLNTSDRSAVVLIHGWNPDGATDMFNTSDWLQLIHALNLRLQGASTKIMLYRWEVDASTGPADWWGSYGQVGFFNAWAAAKNGSENGPRLAQQLRNKSPHLRHLTIIAHSAGSWVANRATKHVLQENPYVIVNVVLLDPFIPGVAQEILATDLTKEEMSKLASFSTDRIHRLENYYSIDLTDSNIVPGSQIGTNATSQEFSWDAARDINQRVDYTTVIGFVPLTFYGPNPSGGDILGHAGPIRFYADSVTATTGAIPNGQAFAPWPFSTIGFFKGLSQQSALFPQIARQPVAPAQPVIQGQPVTLVVSATGVDSFQWYKDGQRCCSSTSTLTIDSASPDDQGGYVVRLANRFGKTFSDNVQLSVAESLTPRLTSIYPSSPASSSAPQAMTFYGANFSSSSTLYFYAPDGAVFGPRTPVYDGATQLRYSATLPNAGSWSVKVVNAPGIESSPYSFSVSAPSGPVAPAQLSASDGQYPNGIVVSWQPVSGATYTLWRSPSLTESKTLLVPGAIFTSLTDTNAVPSRVYYYWVQACDGAGACSGLSAPDSGYAGQVTSLAGAANPGPSNGSTNVSRLIGELRWTNGGGATSYDVYFASHPVLAPGDQVATNTSLTHATIPTLSFGTTYYWRVDAKANGSTVPGTVWQFTTAAQASGDPPARAVYESPSNLATNVPLNTTLAWSRAERATSYDVYLGRVFSPGEPQRLGNTTATSWSISGLQYGTTYYWKVVPKNEWGSAGASVWSFDTEPGAPFAAIWPMPSDGQSGVQTRFLNLHWTDPGSTANSYDVYFGTNPAPGPTEFRGTTRTSNWQPPDLQPNTTYYWQVMSRDNAGVTSGPIWRFTTWTSGPGILDVSPGGLASTGPIGGPFRAGGKTYTISNVGEQTLSFSVSNTRPWVHLSKTSGTLLPGEQTTVVATIGPEAAALPGAYHTDTILFRNDTSSNGHNQRAVSLAIGVPAQPFDIATLQGKYRTVLAVQSDGSLLGWGLNSSGEFGFESPAQPGSPAPIHLGTRTDWAEVTSGFNFTVGRTKDGRLFSWGTNEFGQLGLGDVANRPSPTQIGSDSDWAQVSAGAYHVLARKADGRLFSFGWNAVGQLGVGDLVNRLAPSQIGSETDWTALSAGSTRSVAMKRDGRLFTWGGGASTTGTDTRAPEQVGSFTDWKIAAAGENQVYALRTNGALYAWGSNGNGELGLGDTTTRFAPVQVGSDLDWIAVSAGQVHGLALKADGRLYAWGSNGEGQLGQGDRVDRLSPALVFQNDNILSIAATLRGSYAMLGDGTLYGWGSNGSGEVGIGETWLNGSISVLRPTTVDLNWWLDIGPASSTVAMSASANPSPRWQSVSFSATVAGDNPSGTVTFLDGPATICNAVPVSDGKAVCVTDQLSVGAHSIGATYSGDGNNTSSSAAAVIQTITKQPAIVAITAHTPNPSLSGQPISVGASVAAASLENPPTGAITISDGSSSCTFRLPASTCELSLLTLGEKSLTASYSGDPDNFAALSSPVAHSVTANANLAGLEISAGALSPSFAPDTMAYSASIPNSVSAIVVRPLTSDPSASVKVNGNLVRSGNVSDLLPLAVGSNTVSVLVTAQDGTTTRSYSVFVTRAALLTNADLSSLSLSSGTLTPPFDASITSYTADVPFGVTAVTVTPTSADPAATVKVNGLAVTSGTPSSPIALSTGNNGISIAVTAPDGVTNRTYVVGVTRDLAPASISLSATSLDFGGQSVNTTSPPITVAITNTGVSQAVIASITATTNFAASQSCGTLPPSATCVVNVTFTPTTPGALAGTLTITTSGGAATVALAGNGENSLVTHYYRSILRRAPDPGGKAFWESEASRVAGLGANINETWYALAMAFYNSVEYRSFNRDDNGFITDLYNTFFNRTPDSGGLAFWVGNLQQGMPREVALLSFIFSAEFARFTQAIFGTTAVRSEIDTVVDFYRGILARLPDNAGFHFWVQQFRAAQCEGPSAVYAQVEVISNAYVNSPEYSARNRTNAQYVGDLYNAFLRRGGDLSGVQFWIAELDGGRRTRSQLRQNFLASPEFAARVQQVVVQGCLQ